MLRDVWSGIRDAADILGRARSPLEAAKALVPARLLTRRVLNRGTGPARALGAAAIAEQLRKLTRRLEAEVVAGDGRGLSYTRLRSSPVFAEIEAMSQSLAALSDDQIPGGAAALAFWINLYNVLVIHGVVALGIERSVMEVPSFFGTVAYAIGRYTFTPDEIENGILRANGPHPATGLQLFRAGDPRLAWAAERVDPRVHMALVCAAKACPPISFYDADRVDAQLDLAARTFVEGDVQIDAASRAVGISTLYRYYQRDFGGQEGVRRFLLDHLEGSRHDDLERAFEQGYSVTPRRYDWTLNSLS